MKKIFAIALALVMVLSMASAFAMTCTTGYDWSCSTTTYNCGKVTFEVVPFVRSNDACDSANNFVQSDCAAVVVGERVYFGIKMTVAAGLNKEWYESINTPTLSYKNLAANAEATTTHSDEKLKLPAFATASNDGEGGVFWYTTAGWVEDDDFSGATCVFAKWALKSDVKVCVEATAKNEFTDTDISKWNVSYDGESLVTFADGTDKVTVRIVDEKVARIAGWIGNDAIVFVGMENGLLVDAEGKTYATSCNQAALVAEVMNYFNFTFRTCMTEDAINANFGWNDTIKDCFTWSKNATAIVDADCVVAIPKTGDVSVVAYAVMAVVAAAGTMLKK